MITQAKRIKTKKGDPMMFATLDDLEASVEMLVFGKALEANGDALTTDSIVLVRGRVDHRDREKTSIVAQQIDKFEPTEEQVRKADEEAAKPVIPATALRLHLNATALPARVLGELKDVLGGFPGDCDVVIELITSAGKRRLRLGREFRVARTAGLHAELDDLLGAAMLSPNAAPVESADPADEDPDEDESGSGPRSGPLAGRSRRRRRLGGGAAADALTRQPWLAPGAEPGDYPIGLRRPPGAGLIAVDRGRRIKQRCNHAPGLLDAVLPGEVGAVADQRGVEQDLVRRRVLAALGGEFHIQIDRGGSAPHSERCASRTIRMPVPGSIRNTI